MTEKNEIKEWLENWVSEEEATKEQKNKTKKWLEDWSKKANTKKWLEGWSNQESSDIQLNQQ